MENASIGIFGGSGFYSFLEDTQSVRIETPYGEPSCEIVLGKHGGKDIAFLPRHGKDHRLPPHAINYRANLWAFKELGVKFIISPCAAGSLQPEIKPGDFVVVDQYIDRTKGRKDTFYDEAPVTHMSGATPYSPEFRDIAIQAVKDCNVPCHDTGTVVVIQGPRFSTQAEGRWFHNMGWDVVNMTQYPEVILAQELEMAFVNISLITDYDMGVPGVSPVSVEEMLGIFKGNMDNIRRVIFKMIEAIDVDSEWDCHSGLSRARFT